MGALDDACDVLGDRIRGDEVHLGSEAALARELRLVDRCRRAKRRLDREGLLPLDVIEDEALALLRDGAAHVARDARTSSLTLSSTSSC